MPKEKSPVDEKQGGGRSKKKITRMIIIALVLGLVINIVLVLAVDKKQALMSLDTIDWYDIAIPFLCIVLVYIIDTIRYKVVFWQFKYHIRWDEGLYNNIIGFFFSNITPLAAGGQPVQIYHLNQIGIDTKSATNVVVSRYLEYVLSSLIIVLVFSVRAINLGMQTGIGMIVIFLGMGTTLGMTLIILFVLIKPHLLGHFALWIEKRALGRFVSRLTKRPDWAEHFFSWCMDLRSNVKFLWAEKLPIMLADIGLNCLDITINAFALFFVASQFAPGVPMSLLDFIVISLVVNFVVYYMPTPGAAVSVEAMYIMVLGGLMRNPGAAVTATIVWRIGTYYLHIVLGALVYFLYKPKLGSAIRPDTPH